MLGRFKGEVISTGIRTYVHKESGQTKPQFVVKIKCHPPEGFKDEQGRPVLPFIREWTGTYNQGDNQKYTDEALLRMGYLYLEEGFADFDDVHNGWSSEAVFEVVVEEREGEVNGQKKMFEYVKSIWEVRSIEVKNAIAKDQVVSIMSGLTLPGHAAAMRERVKASNGGKMPEKKAAAPQQNDASFAADDIPF